MNQIFFLVEESCDTKDTGAFFPQIPKMRKGYNYDAYNSVRKIKFGELPNFIPNFDYFIMNGRSKKSDVLSSSMMGGKGFILSNRAKNVFEKYQLPPHIFFPVKVSFREQIDDSYYFFMIVCDFTNNINFSRSQFLICDIINKPIERIFFNTSEEYFNKKLILKEEWHATNIYRHLKTEIIAFNNPIEYDVFFIGGTIDGDIYLTEELKDDLLNSKITGFEFIQTDKFIW